MESNMQKSAVIFILKKEKDQTYLCLGKSKKKGYAGGKWNGFGGKKTEADKNIVDTAIRETKEESGILLNEQDLDLRAHLTYDEPAGNWEVFAFVVEDFEGPEPIESYEMLPKWFPIDKLPVKEMWENDQLWLIPLLEGKCFKGHIVNDENDKLVEHKLEPTTAKDLEKYIH